MKKIKINYNLENPSKINYSNDYQISSRQGNSFVENEIHDLINNPHDKLKIFETNHKILPGSLTGIIYINNIPIQNFIINQNGIPHIMSVTNSYVVATEIVVSHQSGIIAIKFNELTNNAKVLINYEYSN